MKSMSSLFALLAVLLLAGGVTAQEDVQKITFTHKSLAVGDVQTRASSMNMNQDLTMSMGDEAQPPMNQEVDTKEKRRTSILAAANGKVTKVKIEMLDFGFDMKMGGESVPEGLGDMGPPDITGKVVIVELTEDGTVTVKDEEGNAVDEMLEAAGSGEFDKGNYVGWGPRFEKILPRRPVAMNEIITVPKERAMDFMPGYGKAKLGDVESMTLKLVGTKRSLGTDLAVFEVDAKFGGSPDLGVMGGGGGGGVPGLTLRVDVHLTGKISVGVNNLWVYDMELDGPMKLSSEASDEMPFSMDATGKIKTRGLSLYTKAQPEKK